MSRDLEQAVRAILPDFLAAVRAGDASLSLFCESMNKLHQELLDGARAGTVSPDLWSLARSNFSAVAAQGKIFSSATSGFAEAALDLSSEDNADESDHHQTVSLVATLPLFRYFLANICSPYPDTHEKERVAHEVRDLGWHDYDKKKFEDWLNRKRIQSGFIAILRTYCHDDRHAMRNLCHAALFGTAEERAKLPDDALEDIEDMHDFIQSQYDDLRQEEDSTWVDELATRIHAVIGEDSSGDDDSSPDLYSDGDADDCSSSDSASDWSETDVDDDSPCCLIGAKRKLGELSDISPPPTCRPFSCSSSMGSLASPCLTAHSARSISGSSISSMTTVEWSDDDDVRGRPSKRSRQSSSPEPDSMWTGSVEVAPPPVVVAANAAFFTYRTKRRRTHDDLVRLRSTKRSHYASLGVASQSDNPHNLHVFALSDISSIDWAAADCAVTDFHVDAYTIDCTPPDTTVAAEEFADLVLDEEALAEDVLTSSKLQIYTIFRMLLPASARPLPPALAESMTLSFDAQSLSAHDVTSLSQLFALTPEDIAGMYQSMNALAPLATSSSTTEEAVSPPEEVVSPPEDSPSPASSSSSSGCSSPPALSDDSGSSTRSPSVEPDIQPDSLLMSPAALTADYSHLYSELLSGKTTNVDPSEVKVELGAALDFDIASDDLSGAAELLARYLQDSMTAP